MRKIPVPFGEFLVAEWSDKFVVFRSPNGDERIIADCHNVKLARQYCDHLNQLIQEPLSTKKNGN